MEKWKKAVIWGKSFARLGISAHAAGAGYFVVLSLFPMLVLLLGLLRYTGLSVDVLVEALEGFLPHALLPAAKRLITGTYRNTSGMVLSVSALATLWSAGRGVSGLMRGLNRVYCRRENRSWLRVRWLSMVYTGAFLTVVLVSLTVGVFGASLSRNTAGLLAGWGKAWPTRFLLLLLLQTGLFCGMFMALPNGGNGFLPSLPGALLSSAGWLLFSRLYSWYILHFTGYSNIFGSVYAVALSMLWLYICLCILFFGGALNAWLEKGEK